MKLTFEEYKDFYFKHGNLYDNPIKNKNPYTEKQLETKYKKYCKKFDEEGKTKDQQLRYKAFERDKGCRLWAVLTPQERASCDVPFKQLDMAHVLPKKAFPSLRYELDNVVMLYRTFHNRLDEGKDPLTGKIISKDEVAKWWCRIVGEELIEDLMVYAFTKEKVKEKIENE